MEGHSIIQFTLVGGGPPSNPTLESALEFIDIARDRIVWSFSDLTKEKMHELWKRKDSDISETEASASRDGDVAGAGNVAAEGP